jgi:hypothetical protein
MVDLQTELFEIFWLILLTWSFEVYLVLSSHIVFTPLTDQSACGGHGWLH